MSRQANYNLWAERVAAYRSSKLTLKAWCSENEVSKSAMHYWITKLNKEAASSHIEWSHVPSPEQVHFEDNNTESGISLTVNGVEVKLQKDFHHQTLSNLLQVLQQYA